MMSSSSSSGHGAPDSLEKPRLDQREVVLVDDPALVDALQEAYLEVVRRGEDGSLFVRGIKDAPDSPRSWPTWKRCKSTATESTT